MINLRKQLKKLMESIHPRSYFQKGSDKAEFPYVIYDLPNSFSNEEQEIFNLDVDIWDRPLDGDTTELEMITDKLWKILHNYKYIDDNIQFSIYRGNRLTLTDDDPRIKRRKLVFELRYFDRRLNDE